MATLRRRYYAWLIKAYFKKMRRTIISSVILGILVFFAFIGLLNYYFRPLIFKTTENVGYAGTYTIQTLPREILQEVSFGLTQVDQDGKIIPAAAARWKIENDKVYTFTLKKGTYFHNGDELTSEKVNLSFKDVNKKIVDKYTLQYVLKNPYSPFLASVARPIFGKNLEGVGKFKVEDIDVNGGFVRSITLVDVKNKNKKRKIYFYPTQKALKVAFMLGEITKAYGVTSTSVDQTDLGKWAKVKSQKYINYTALVAIFYNNDDSILNNKKIRQALNYSLPESISVGERAFGPIPPTSLYFSRTPTYKIADTELSKTLLSTVKDPIKDPLVISTTEEYQKVALDVQKEWEKIGIKSKIKIVQNLPSDFQVFIYRIQLPEDPDQYVLWHSDQMNNITHYKNLRIDKLLEDGRSITDVEKRRKIYADFQKYLTDDVPASFYFFPLEYNLSKK
ncbi:MAG: ABC transporter substrate-binding protein [Candidatus Levybacteria bacterium]|nr:ABC transporter substrate-binding protein [Candidatus Levybacteria bacterium]